MGPALPDPRRDGDPAGVPAGPDDFPEIGSDRWRLLPSGTDGMDDPQVREAYLATLADQDEPGDPDEEEDPDNAPPPGLDDAQLAALIAEAQEITQDETRAAAHAARLGMTAAMAAVGAAIGRRGPGMPGSAGRFPGEYCSPAAGFASGRPLDVAPGCATLGLFAEDAAGDGDRYAGATDDELLGAICAWGRVEAHAGARKHAAAAELIRRRPAGGCVPEGPAQMPAAWDEFTSAELAPALGRSRGAAEDLLRLSYDLEVKLPGTKAAFWAGIVDEEKAEIIAAATAVLDAGEARAAEALVLDRAGSLTPAGLRSAIACAVMQVAPDKARKRREQAAKAARVERWAEDSGNAGLAGRELPPAEVLAADQRVTWWARRLKEAGLDGDMDQLRARAYLDILLGIDSRPPGNSPHGTPGQSADGEGGASDPGHPRTRAPVGPLAGVIPPGFAGKVNLTIPLITLTQHADRPGDLGGIGPIDPDLARDLAAAAARNPRTTWCVTVTDSQGHAIGHGCARPEPASSLASRAKRRISGAAGGHDPPRASGDLPLSTDDPPAPRFTFAPDDPPAPRFTFAPDDPPAPRFSFAPEGPHGPRGGYGTWRLSTGESGQPDLIVAIGPIATGDCDHRHEAKGHDPGVLLRHLTQVRHATCTAPGCRRPAAQCDFEHNVPYDAGGRTCLCNGNPECRHDHRVKQHPRWTVEQLPGGYVRWTAPSGRQYATEPTRYPI